jgi:hypothetical protein
LCNGQLIGFEGKTSPVYSPVHVIQKDGKAAPQFLGFFFFNFENF